MLCSSDHRKYYDYYGENKTFKDIFLFISEKNIVFSKMFFSEPTNANVKSFEP